MTPMKLGFSGTRRGMSDWQRKRLRAFLRHFRPVEFHHGDCVGADAQAHKLVRETLPDCRIVVHPGNITNLRANCKGDEVREPLMPLIRNVLILDDSHELVAAPETEIEQPKGGTWFTIREARKRGMTVDVLEREKPEGFLP